MKRSLIVLCVSIILISAVFAGCKGAEGGKVTDTAHDSPVLTELESELSTIADNITDILPDMTGNITESNNTAT